MRLDAPAALSVRLALALIIAAASLLATGSWRVYSNTWDEPEHLAAGVELLDRGRYEYDTEHPPLARTLLALGPWLAGAHSFATPPPEGTQEGVAISPPLLAASYRRMRNAYQFMSVPIIAGIAPNALLLH